MSETQIKTRRISPTQPRLKSSKKTILKGVTKPSTRTQQRHKRPIAPTKIENKIFDTDSDEYERVCIAAFRKFETFVSIPSCHVAVIQSGIVDEHTVVIFPAETYDEQKDILFNRTGIGILELRGNVKSITHPKLGKHTCNVLVYDDEEGKLDGLTYNHFVAMFLGLECVGPCAIVHTTFSD